MIIGNWNGIIWDLLRDFNEIHRYLFGDDKGFSHRFKKGSIRGLMGMCFHHWVSRSNMGIWNYGNLCEP
jgi:hypothetical protein